MQDAGEMMPRDNLHEALWAMPPGWTGNNLRRHLRVASAHVRPGLVARRGRSTGSERAEVAAGRCSAHDIGELWSMSVRMCVELPSVPKCASVVCVLGMH